MIYLVRHAVAVGRSSWDGDDLDRPLSNKGRRQAEGLVRLLADLEIDRILSSPATRCIDTVSPLAKARGPEVEVVDELAESTSGKRTAHLLRDLAKQGFEAVACTHGDVIPEVLRFLKDHGLKLADQFVWAKGSTWVLEWDGDHFSKGHYLLPVE